MHSTYLLVQLDEASLVLNKLRACGYVIDGADRVRHFEVRLRQQLPQTIVLRLDLDKNENEGIN